MPEVSRTPWMMGEYMNQKDAILLTLFILALINYYLFTHSNELPRKADYEKGGKYYDTAAERD